MHFERSPARTLWAAALALLLALTCTACAHKPPASEPAVVATPQPARQDPVIGLLTYASALSRGTPEQREQAVEAARRAVAHAPGAMNYAHLALAYGAPAQRRYTPDEVARYARLALQANNAHWSDAARQYLRDYARLYAQLSSQRSSVIQTRAPTSTGPTSAPARVDDKRRIAELQSQLEDARRKLHELANIENNLGTDTP